MFIILMQKIIGWSFSESCPFNKLLNCLNLISVLLTQCLSGMGFQVILKKKKKVKKKKITYPTFNIYLYILLSQGNVDNCPSLCSW